MGKLRKHDTPLEKEAREKETATVLENRVL
jgi:hypothetical protein